MSDGIEYGCTDSGATNYDANANTDDGSCQYPAPAPTPEVEEPQSNSSGTMYWIFLTLLCLLQRRRR